MTDDGEIWDDWDEWIQLSDAAQDAILNAEMARYQRMLDAMTVREQVAHHRHFVLNSIMQNRRRLRDPNLRRIDVIDELWRNHIRLSQKRLLKLRIWRATGTYPGAA
jgi:hypothetical protein